MVFFALLLLLLLLLPPRLLLLLLLSARCLEQNIAMVAPSFQVELSSAPQAEYGDTVGRPDASNKKKAVVAPLMPSCNFKGSAGRVRKMRLLLLLLLPLRRQLLAIIFAHSGPNRGDRSKEFLRCFCF